MTDITVGCYVFPGTSASGVVNNGPDFATSMAYYELKSDNTHLKREVQQLKIKLQKLREEFHQQRERFDKERCVCVCVCVHMAIACM